MTSLRRIVLLFFCLLCLGPLAGGAWALDQKLVAKAEMAAQTYTASLGDIDKGLQLPTLSDAQITEFRGKIEDIRAAAIDLSASLVQPLADLTAQLKLLPPAPVPGAPAESSTVTDQRALLTGQINQLQGIKTQLDLAASSAEQLASRASALQRNLFLTRVFEGGRSIFNPSLWRDTWLGFGLMSSRLATLFRTWWATVSVSGNFVSLFAIPAAVLLVSGLAMILRRRVREWTVSSQIASRPPSDIERIWRVVRALLVATALLLLLFLPVYGALYLGGLITGRFEMVYWGVADIFATTVIYWLLARRLAAPGYPAWRIIDIDDQAASRLPLLVALLAFVAAFTSSTGTIADGLFLPVTYTIGQASISALIMLTLQALILYTLRNQQGVGTRLPGRSLYFTWVGVLAPPLWLAILGGFAALLFGYVALAGYLAQQITDTIVIGIVLVLFHHLTDLVVAASFDPQSGPGRVLRRVTGLGERSIERLGLFARVIVDAVLVVIGLPLMFVQWAVTWIDFRSLVTSAFQGFRLGTITVSPGFIFIVALTLLLGIVVTNLMVRWLDGRVLSETRLDKGVQDSLRKGVSYAGYMVATGVALSAAGLDLSTLTIVFGALGVGIGFGLQSIVNNFISGLILLAERPIRVGDWVVVDAGEGLVKRINVRATEIETFDNCSVIVPNLSLITGVVKNWTHGDTMGRFTVSVSVAYGSDAEKVRDLLMGCAKAHPKVLSYPEPVVFLQRLAPAGLDFDIKAAVGDIFYGAFVASDIRYEILKVFAANSIYLAQPVTLLQAPPTAAKGA